MRQIGAEKDDPLKRIQEEINEVARRERELREKMQNQTEITTTGDLVDSTTTTTTIKNDNNNCSSPSTSPTPSQSVLSSQDDTPSLESSVNSKDGSLDEHNSDDSGISASSSPINGITSSSTKKNNNNNIGKTIKKYIRPNGYNNLIPSPQSQKSLTRTVSTPQIYQPISSNQQRRITIGPAQKGLMQRFIATRGKISTNHNQINNNMMMTKDLNGTNPMIDYPRQSLFIPTITMTPPIIERDSDGKPIRRGYIPVEEKIQKELKDIKCRETELKKFRRLSKRQSQPDLLDSIENETMISDDDDDSDVEHCYPPGKLRSSKSISELCESINSNSISPRTTPSPNFDHRSRNNGMRPAVSLAQLCDLSPAEEAPSSHQLIAKWESLIQQNA